MQRTTFRIVTFALAALLLAALPAASQIIPAGPDRWVTPPDGGTVFPFPAGDVEGLCNAPVSFNWDRNVKLTGAPDAGNDWDTSIVRLRDANVSDVGDVQTIPITVREMRFRSIEPMRTPCGKINWHAKATDRQPVTKMSIVRTNEKGGEFKADIAVSITFYGVTTSGIPIGELHYTVELPANGSTPWSFNPNTGVFRPGIDEGDNCIEVLREKLLTATGNHIYYIENLIAEGKCGKRPQ